VVLGFGFWVLGFGFWVLGFGFWVLGFGFWVLGFGENKKVQKIILIFWTFLFCTVKRKLSVFQLLT